MLERGNVHAPGAKVEPAFPGILAREQLELPAVAASAATCGRRLALARWIASPTNPLTARVMANRVWQHHFGRGIVRSPNNFGALGTPPTHPELLDWLADRLVAEGWRLKPLHRLIMLSSAYQMSSRADEPGRRGRSDQRSVFALRHAPAQRRGAARFDPVGRRPVESRKCMGPASIPRFRPR